MPLHFHNTNITLASKVERQTDMLITVIPTDRHALERIKTVDNSTSTHQCMMPDKKRLSIHAIHHERQFSPTSFQI
jgi:hypothetical protein